MNFISQKRTLTLITILIAAVGFLNCSSKGTAVIAPPVVPVTPPADPPLLTVSAIDSFGALRVSGTQIVGKDNKPVQLRGVSFFWSQWMGKFYTAGTVKWLKEDWYCNIVRAAMGVEEGGYLTDSVAEKRKVFDLVDAAIAEGIYVIIDWHDHHATDHLKEAKSFFAEIAQKYGNRPNIIYEPFNEPLQISWSSQIKPYHQAIIDTIRKYDPDNLIICGTSTWSQDVDIAANDPLKGDNIAYTLHFYAGTHKQSLRDKATTALAKGVALMVTEFGTTNATGDGPVDRAETDTWLAFLDAKKISWCNWSVADKAEGSAILLSGASPTGNWSLNQLTNSGFYIRSEMKSKNPRFK